MSAPQVGRRADTHPTQDGMTPATVKGRRRRGGRCPASKLLWPLERSAPLTSCCSQMDTSTASTLSAVAAADPAGPASDSPVPESWSGVRAGSSSCQRLETPILLAIYRCCLSFADLLNLMKPQFRFFFSFFFSFLALLPTTT